MKNRISTLAQLFILILFPFNFAFANDETIKIGMQLEPPNLNPTSGQRRPLTRLFMLMYLKV